MYSIGMSLMTGAHTSIVARKGNMQLGLDMWSHS